MSRHTAMRVAPTAVAAVLALTYVITSPASLDLAAHLLRAKLFSAEGFGLWNNWWYAGHNVTSYSVLFEPLAAALTPQLTAALAAVASAAIFEALAYGTFRRHAYLASLWFGAATATELFAGRLTFAFGLAPALGAALALQRRRPYAAARARLPDRAREPGGGAVRGARRRRARRGHPPLADRPQRRRRGARAGRAARRSRSPKAERSRSRSPRCGRCSLIAAVALPMTRAAPGAQSGDRVVRGRLRRRVRAAHPDRGERGPARNADRGAGGGAADQPTAGCCSPSPPRCCTCSSSRRSATSSTRRATRRPAPRITGRCWRTCANSEGRRSGSRSRRPAFTTRRTRSRRITRSLAGGSDSSTSSYDNLFYAGPLTAATYDAWLHEQAVRFVALADAPLDYAARSEVRLIERGLPYLHEVFDTRHWRVYEVTDPTPIVTGAATLTSLGPNSVTVNAQGSGTALVRVHFTPYWILGRGQGCVGPSGQFTELRLRHAGPAQLTIQFALDRIGANSPRCNQPAR